MFIEAMLVELPPQAGDLSALSFEQIRARADRSILTAPQFMARDQVTVVYTMDDVIRLSITPSSLPDDDVWLDIKLTGDAKTTTSQRLHDGRPSSFRRLRSRAPTSERCSSSGLTSSAKCD